MEQSTQMTFATGADLYAGCCSADAAIQSAAYQALWDYLYRVAFQLAHDLSDAEAIAEDCAQLALIRVHTFVSTCRDPAAFRAWARTIVKNITLNELSRRGKLTPLPSDDTVATVVPDPHPPLETTVVETVSTAELRELINKSPISDRSRRVVLGRYLDDLSDTALAQRESILAGRTVLISHVQVTRTKNIAKLRSWELMQVFLKEQP